MERLKNYLNISAQRCADYFESYDMSDINPSELRLGAREYFLRGGKRLRPAVLSLSAGAMGGRAAELAVTPAMVSAELFHTFTLVHDDIIDNDDTRRGGKSVHVLVRDLFGGNDGASDYGRDVAILAGDTLHAMAVKMLLECASSPLFSPTTVIGVLKLLEGECINELLAGETNDTRMGLIKSESFDVGTSEETLEVMRQKTGVLFSYCAKAGAMLGLNTDDENAREVVALGRFASLCGIAFQLKDDILGITSDEKTLGKPIGSDIREGKKTIILQESYKNATPEEKRIIERTVSNKNAELSDIERVKEIFNTRGGLAKANAIADDYINQAMLELRKIPVSEYSALFELVAKYMSARNM